MSYIKIECDNCNTTHQIPVADFSFESVDSDERQMGVEITYEATVEIDCDCGQSIEVTHHFWEYPEGVENHKETDVSGASVIKNKL